MALSMKGQVTVDAPPEQVWSLLFNVEAMKEMANRIPGVVVEQLYQVEEDKYAVTATISIGMVKGRYNFTITVLDKRPPEYVKARTEGKAEANTMGGDIALTLTPQDGRTLLGYQGTGNVKGPIASLGQRLIDTVGKQFVASAAKALATEIGLRNRAQAGGEAPAS